MKDPVAIHHPSFRSNKLNDGVRLLAYETEGHWFESSRAHFALSGGVGLVRAEFAAVVDRECRRAHIAPLILF